MKTLSIDVRRAEPHDARAISEAHRLSWQQAYAGLIPHRPLTQMLERRGEIWWKKATRGSATMLVVEVAGVVAGYATLGLSRARGLPHDGEIYELYLRPEFQGMGFGRRLFNAARRDMAQSGLKNLVIWALTDNDPALEFYRALGGRMVARSSENFGTRTLDKVAFAWPV